MGQLWVPPQVDRKLREERNAYTASVEAMAQRVGSVIEEFTARLREIDPYLELIFSPPKENLPAGMVPGRYMCMRHNPGAPPSLMVIETEDGKFMEPGSKLLDDLRSRDMWSPQAVRAREEKKRARLAYEERQKEREREERRAEILERWAAVSRTFVSMDQSTPWSQNANGRRGVRRG